MNRDEEIIKQREIREKRKKILAVSVCAVVGLLMLMGIIIFILSAITNYSRSKTMESIDKETRQSYIYANADYGYNILEDEEYLRLDREIWVNEDGVVHTVIKEDNFKSYSPEIQFMYNVINMIINGDYEEYNKIFTDDYIKKAGDKELREFTMQQLFEIELELVNYSESGNAAYSDIMVSYRIRNNNGTFRLDLDVNDGFLPVVYKLVSDSTGIQVDGLLTYYKYTTGLYD